MVIGILHSTLSPSPLAGAGKIPVLALILHRGTNILYLRDFAPGCRACISRRKPAMRNTTPSRSSTVQSVVRACEIVKSFRHEGEELLLSDVMERTSLHRTTAFRLLQSLVTGGMLERTARGIYRCPFPPSTAIRFRLGFAAQTDSEFSRGVNESLQRAAARERVDLVMVNNRYSVKEALRNADLLVQKKVDLVLEFQTYERVAAVISSKFLEARIPVIAIEIPHPGAVYFGANNYQAGLIGGRALGRWAKDHWEGSAEQVLLIGLPIAGPLPALRITGIQDGLAAELPRLRKAPVVHLDGKGDFDQILGVVRRWLR